MDIFVVEQKKIVRHYLEAPFEIPQNTVWIDLLCPTEEEIKAVQERLGVDLPSSSDMASIEVSNRLYQENKNTYMTASVLVKSQSPDPEIWPTSFIIAGKTLITVRYCDSTPFKDFLSHISRLGESQIHGVALLIGLIGALTNHLADVLERIGHEVDMTNRRMFKPAQGRKRHKVDFQEILWEIGHSGDLISKVREVLVSVYRMAGYFSQIAAAIGGTFDDNTTLANEIKDIQSLMDHAGFLSTKVSFILDATLGRIGIEQNNIMKIFSYFAALFMPPTLISSIYGMNFDHMPELHFIFGYPIALLLMALVALTTYHYFKRNGWL